MVLRGELTWGQWRYIPTEFALVHANGYRMPLLSFDSASSALYHINEFVRTEHFLDSCAGALVRAIDELRGGTTGPMWRILSERELLFPIDHAPDLSARGYNGVYAIGAGDRVKIGRAVDIAKRLKELQVGNHEPLEVLGILSHSSKDERWWHDHFSHLRTVGEWFFLGEQIAVHIRDANRLRTQSERPS